MFDALVGRFLLLHLPDRVNVLQGWRRSSRRAGASR